MTYRLIESAVRSSSPLSDLVLLRTCNRVEVYALTRAPRDAAAMLVRVFGLPDESYVYALEDADAAAHLLRVAGGLDSVALGETQIADQVGRAPKERPAKWKREQGLAEFFARAARSAPKLRRLTGIDRDSTSASHAAVRYVRQVVGLDHPRVTLLGTGKMARIAAEALRGTARIVVVNRDARRAATTAQRLGGRAARLRDLPKILESTDVLITATSADRRIVSKRVLAHVSSKLAGRRLWILDLGVPRNVDPAAADLHGVTLLTVDDLGPWAKLPPPPSALAKAERQLRRDAERSLEILRPRDADLVVSLRRAAEDVRRSEVERALGYLPHATERDRAVLDKMADRLVNRLLHGPTEFVRRLQADEDETAMAAFLETWDILGGGE